MTKVILFLLILFQFPSHAENAADLPAWVTKEKIELIESIGIDSKSDVKVRGNYRIGFAAKKELKLKNYKCPVGTSVDVSRNIILVRPPEGGKCSDDQNGSYDNLKLDLDGSVSTIK